MLKPDPFPYRNHPLVKNAITGVKVAAIGLVGAFIGSTITRRRMERRHQAELLSKDLLCDALVDRNVELNEVIDLLDPGRTRFISQPHPA